jgi:hypothetical protein
MDMIRVKDQPNGQYKILTEEEFDQLEREHLFEYYRWTKCLYEDDGSLTGVNAVGNRVVIEDSPSTQAHSA